MLSLLEFLSHPIEFHSRHLIFYYKIYRMVKKTIEKNCHFLLNSGGLFYGAKRHFCPDLFGSQSDSALIII